MKAARNQYSLHKRSKLAESVTFGLQQVSLRPFRVLVGHFSDVPVATECFRRDGSHQVCEDQMEGVLDLMISRLGVALPRGVDAAIWYGPAEAHFIVVLLLQKA